MRGEKEQKCLDLIKNAIFTNDGIPIQHPYTNQTYLEVSDEEFTKEKVWFINSEYYKSCFGLLEKDRDEIEKIMKNTKPNSNLNNFPDFTFDDGFIEHFQITSSKTTRKGSEHIKEMSCFDAKVKQETEEIKHEWNKTPSFNKVRAKHWSIENPQHSHEYLIKSFERNWNNHLKSLEKYKGNKEVGIFMIEYMEFALSMSENVYANWVDGMTHGDMREPEKFKCYRLSRDKKMLNFMYEYRNQIKYVIFVYCNGFEIIKLESIPYLLKLLPWDYVIYPLLVKNVSSMYNITMDAKTKEEGIK